MTRKNTLVDELVSRLCTEIFTGIHEVGTVLPPIRELAKRYETTVPTIQRVIARLEENRLRNWLEVIDWQDRSAAAR